MSLIPSESASFPDLLGRGLGASKNSKWRAPFGEEVAPPANVSARVAAAKPVVAPASAPRSNGSIEKARPTPASPSPANRKPPQTKSSEGAPAPAPAPPIEAIVQSAIPIVRIARSNVNRAAHPASSEPLAPDEQGRKEEPFATGSPILPPPRTALAKPRLRPLPTLQPRFKPDDLPARSPEHREAVVTPVSLAPPAVAPEPIPPLHFQPATSTGEPEEFGFPEATLPWPNLQRRRRNRLIRFIVCEVIGLALLVSAVMIGLSHRSVDDPLSVVTKILTITFAIGVAVVPILFYGLPETLPRIRR